MKKNYIVKAEGNIISNETYYHTSFINGIIKDVKLKDGEIVNKGEIILELDDGRIHSELDALNLKKTDIESELNVIQLYKQSLEENKNHLVKSNKYIDYYQKIEYYLSVIEDESLLILSQKEMLSNRELKLKKLKEEIEELKKETSEENKSLIESKTETLDTLQEEINSINNNINTQNSQSSQLYYQLVIDVDSKKDDLDNEYIEICSKLDESKKLLENLTIKAETTGVLHYLSDVKKGITVTQGQALASITPVGTEIIAEVFIESSDFTKVEIAQDCKLEIIGTNTRKVGLVKGKLNHIDSGTINKENNGTIQTFYRAEISLENDSLLIDKKEKSDLEISMPIIAHIVYDEESYFDWIMSLLNFK